MVQHKSSLNCVSSVPFYSQHEFASVARQPWLLELVSKANNCDRFRTQASRNVPNPAVNFLRCARAVSRKSLADHLRPSTEAINAVVNNEQVEQ